MSKTIILLSMTVFELIGNFVPTWFGNNDFFGGWSLLAGFIGGIVGIWFGVILSRKLYE